MFIYIAWLYVCIYYMISTNLYKSLDNNLNKKRTYVRTNTTRKIFFKSWITYFGNKLLDILHK